MNKHFNHSPFVHSVWVPFNGQRFKVPYLIRTKSGEEMLGIPNGDAWYANNTWIEDKEITHIQSLPDGGRPCRVMSGSQRIERDIQYFGLDYPVYCGEKHGFVWEDELPEGKVLLPIRVYAFRNIYHPQKKVWLHVAQAYIVDEDLVPFSLDSIRTCLQEDYFWTATDINVMNTDDIVQGMFIHHIYTKMMEKKLETVKVIVDYIRSCGELSYQHVEMMHSYIEQYEKDPEHFDLSSLSIEIPPLSEQARRFLRLRRGPEAPVIDAGSNIDVERLISSTPLLRALSKAEEATS